MSTKKLPERLEITQPARRVDRGRIALACFLPNEEFGDQVVFSNCAPALAVEIIRRYNAHERLAKFVERIEAGSQCRSVFEHRHALGECIGCDARALLTEVRT